MVRARIWLTCAAAHDPVSPILLRPALIGWQAKFRQVDLTIERSLAGGELLARMKGWVTSDVGEVARLLEKKGRLKLLDDRDLVIECQDGADFEALAAEVAQSFGDQVSLEQLN